MLTNSDDIGQNQKKQVNQIIQTLTELANKKSEKATSKKIIQQQKNQKILALTLKNQSQNFSKQIRGNSSVKIRKNAPVLKKNIYGYYENPQLHNNQPNLPLTKLLSQNKTIQTVPEDLSVITVRPVIKLTVVDGNLKPQRSRHCTNFYVRLNYNKENKLQVRTKVIVNNLQPVWNEQFFLYQYTFPFFTLDVMNQSKGLKDYSIGDGRLQVTRTQIPKYVNVKNDGQHQGRVRFMITYPKGRMYQFIVNSIKLIYPVSFPMPKDTLTIKISFNSTFAVNFEIGQKIKYFDDDYRGNNKFIIQDGSDGDLRVSFDIIKKKGSLSLSQIYLKEGQQQISVVVGENWTVVLQGVVLLIVSEQDQPQKIAQQVFDENYHKYFSLIAQRPVTTVCYNNTSLNQHIKLPLVFRFDDRINIFKIFKQSDQKSSQKMLPITHDKQNDQKQLQVMEIQPIVMPNTNIINTSHLQPNSKKRLLRAPKIVYEIKLKMVQGKLPVTLATQQIYFEKILADVELKCGDRMFSVPGSDLLQNFYITMSRTFKSIGFVKFKIGYVIHNNLLKDKAEQKKKPEQVITYKQLQVLDTGGHYVGLQLSTAYFPQFSSTADYSITFQFGSGNQSSKKSGNMLQWRQLFILPFNEQFKIKVMQYSLLGNKCIYQSMIKIQHRDLKLRCKFINFGEKGKCYIFLGKIQSVTDIYSLKVQRIEGQLLEDEDWIGDMDPYIKFNALGRLLYCTQKLQQAGKNPVWRNDQFVALTAANFINISVYDDDLIGKDDYLGECTLNIPDMPTKVLQGMLKRAKQGQKQFGKITLNGQFNKLANVTPIALKQSKVNLPENIFKITIYKLQINKKVFSDSDTGFFTYTQNNQNKQQNFAIKSHPFERVQQKNNQSETILVDFTIWVKQVKENITIEIWKIIKTLFTSKDQIFASCTIPFDLLARTHIIKTQATQIILKNNPNFGYVGNLHYIVEPVQSSRALYIQQTALQTDENLILLSDTQDCISFNNRANISEQKLLMLDQKIHVLTQEEYKSIAKFKAANAMYK